MLLWLSSFVKWHRFYLALIILQIMGCSSRHDQLIHGPQQSCREIITCNDSNIPISEWNNDTVAFHYGNNADYRLVKRVGAGTFGEAYLASNVKKDQPCVIKLYNSEMRAYNMLREISVLQSVCGGPNIIRLYDVLIDEVTQSPAMVMEYVNFTHHKELYPTLTAVDIQYYMKQLLLAIDYLHQRNIMHRDIKPHNVLIDHQKRQLRLIDFGISCWHAPGVEHRDSGTYAYMAPETLFDYNYYDLKVDIWSFGVTLAGLLFKREFLFPGASKNSQLNHYTKAFGTEGLIKLVEDYNIPHDRNITAFKARPKRSWTTFVNFHNRQFTSKEAFDVLDRTLIYDPKLRANTSELLNMPYFK